MIRPIFGLVLVISTTVSFAQSIAPWPMERQDRWGSGRATQGPAAASLTLPWRLKTFATGFPVSNGPSLGPNGIGYFGDWVDDKVFKFNYNTGDVITSLQLENFIFCTPALASDDRLFVTTDNQVGRLWSVTPSTMTTNWFQTLGYWAGSPTLGPDENIVGLTSSGTAYRFDQNDNIVWSHSGLGTNHGTTVFSRDDSKVFVSNGTHMTALNYSNGLTAWDKDYGSQVGAPATAPNGTLIFGTDDGTVRAVDPTTGATLWSKITAGEVRAAAGFSPGGGTVYIGSYDGSLYSYRLSDGTQNWAFPTTLWVNEPPTVGRDGRIYIHNKAGDLYSIDSSGHQIWHVLLNGEARGPMTIGPDGTLFVGFTGNSSSGLAMIRQQPIRTTFMSFTQNLGTTVSGGLPDVATSNNKYLVGAPSATSTNPMTRYVFQGVAPTSGLAQLWVWFEASTTVSGINQKVEFWDWISSVWVQADQRASTTSDSTAYVKAPGDFTRYIQSGTGAVDVRVSFKPATAGFGSAWNSKIDRLNLGTVPIFQP